MSLNEKKSLSNSRTSKRKNKKVVQQAIRLFSTKDKKLSSKKKVHRSLVTISI